jgi:hypothetical protein
MLFGVASSPVVAQIQTRPAPQPVAILTVISGDVLMRTPAGDFTTALDGAVLYVGNVLRTSADARALMTLFEGSTLELDPASDIVIEDARSGSTFAQALGRGLRVVMHLTTADSRYEPTTPAATASVRGIDFEVAGATGLGALPTTLVPTALLVTPAVEIPTSMHFVAPTETTTARANTTSVARSSSRGDRARKVLAQPLAPPASSTERSRESDDKDDDEVKD